MKAPIFSTERLVLRKMVSEDVDSLLEIFSDKEVMKYYPSCKNRNDTVKWIEWTLHHYKVYGFGMWIVEDKGSGQVLGQCGLVLQKLVHGVEVELGYLFAKQHWGKGYATEAAFACKKYAFNELGLSKLISLIDPQNKASLKVAKRIGMTYECTVIKWNKELDLYACQ
ncbi:GNAT family N-acetyltransferase [Pseudalkalibacillus hwajinpoensis]|uniref:GNAT family N-acetyltransferase n=1 Tax=Guptibacillus hwajinpoensis TaxID=208199 RepID=UPI001CD2E38F|nr:GNAT family N-acetyltransferase [Pseudalkalibacillus hwajinpoensis]MCA0992092.1 GNAT family N-acetyltransferase [Pseudalkalibacillus hwajinpoensis]